MAGNMYWQEEKIRIDLLESQQTGVLTKFLESKFVELVDESYWKFSKDYEHEKDIKQDCYLKMFSVWKKLDLDKFEKTMPFFTSCIKNQIYHSIRLQNGLTLNDDLSVSFISFDSIFENDHE